jgi:hypothetical protein
MAKKAIPAAELCTDRFVQDLAKLVARHIRLVEDDRELAIMRLQDATSMFSPYFRKELYIALAKQTRSTT